MLFNPPVILAVAESPRKLQPYTCVSPPEALAEDGASPWVESWRNTVGGEREPSTSTHLSLLLPDHRPSVTRYLMFSLSRLYPPTTHTASH